MLFDVGFTPREMLVKRLGGFHRVTSQMKWGYIYSKLHLPQHFTAGPRNLQAAFKRYLYPLDDISRKLGTELDELPLARPRHQTLANQNASQLTKSGTGTTHSSGTGSRQQSGAGSSSTPSGSKTVSSQSRSTDKVPSTTGTITAPTPSTPNSKECSPPKVASIEPIVESASFSSPPVLSPLMTTHEHSPSPDTARSTRGGGSKRDTLDLVPMEENMDSSNKLLDSLSESRSNDKSRECRTIVFNNNPGRNVDLESKMS
ncbi:unnamed protein product [Echinostoma caproni]|uniref:ARID domain-containing protein n=1 Tax=Echinostoma caproni TaxID=27848 RepID=A0A183ANE0_9TREM|nr:unnamed protein product [Echinostoma caproni]